MESSENIFCWSNFDRFCVDKKKSLRAMDSAEAKFNYRVNHNEEDMGA